MQTHNYLVEAPPDGPQQQPRAIQFPIIQVNNTNNNTGKNETIRSLPGPSAITKSSFSKYSTSARIVEIGEEEEEDFATQKIDRS